MDDVSSVTTIASTNAACGSLEDTDTMTLLRCRFRGQRRAVIATARSRAALIPRAMTILHGVSHAWARSDVASDVDPPSAAIIAPPASRVRRGSAPAGVASGSGGRTRTYDQAVTAARSTTELRRATRSASIADGRGTIGIYGPAGDRSKRRTRAQTSCGAPGRRGRCRFRGRGRRSPRARRRPQGAGDRRADQRTLSRPPSRRRAGSRSHQHERHPDPEGDRQHQPVEGTAECDRAEQQDERRGRYQQAAGEAEAR